MNDDITIPYLRVAKFSMDYLKLVLGQKELLKEFIDQEKQHLEIRIEDAKTYFQDLYEEESFNENARGHDPMLDLFRQQEYENYLKDTVYGDMDFDSWDSVDDFVNQETLEPDEGDDEEVYLNPNLSKKEEVSKTFFEDLNLLIPEQSFIAAKIKRYSKRIEKLKSIKLQIDPTLNKDQLFLAIKQYELEYFIRLLNFHKAQKLEREIGLTEFHRKIAELCEVVKEKLEAPINGEIIEFNQSAFSILEAYFESYQYPDGLDG